MDDNPKSTHRSFDEFVDTIRTLRSPGGCPWDLEQTHSSISSNMIEEAYEAVDAIEQGDVEHLREELGDVLLQVVLQSQIAADCGEFTIDEVCEDVNEKIIRRHPHVFGNAKAKGANEVLDSWDKIKRQEQEQRNLSNLANGKGPESILDSVGKNFPALIQAQKISRKAASCGFDWEGIDDIWEKVCEEEAELKEAYAHADKDRSGKLIKDGSGFAHVEEELGDVLFSLVNVARRMGIDSERALRSTCDKFRRRWSFMEGSAREQGHSLEGMDPNQMEELWKAAKGGRSS